jgi:hypothetical protein
MVGRLKPRFLSAEGAEASSVHPAKSKGCAGAQRSGVPAVFVPYTSTCVKERMIFEMQFTI